MDMEILTQAYSENCLNTGITGSTVESMSAQPLFL